MEMDCRGSLQERWSIMNAGQQGDPRRGRGRQRTLPQGLRGKVPEGKACVLPNGAYPVRHVFSVAGRGSKGFNRENISFTRLPAPREQQKKKGGSAAVWNTVAPGDTDGPLKGVKGDVIDVRLVAFTACDKRLFFWTPHGNLLDVTREPRK